MSERAELRKKRRVRRFHNLLALSAIVGLLTGAAVIAISTSIEWIFVHIEETHTAVYVAAMPLVGLILTALILHYAGNNATPDTSDAFLRRFHDDRFQFDSRRAFARVGASIATLGFGGALGVEGPSIYSGAVIGDRIRKRFRKWAPDADRRTLLVAGAAAGVAAVFKAPATGAVFALEVPFQEAFAREMLLPALVASASSYLVFVAAKGVTPIFHVSGAAPFSFREIAGALLLGIIAGLGARVFILMVKVAKHLQNALKPTVKIPLFGGLLFVATLLGYQATQQTFVIGPPYPIFSWLLDPGRSFWIIAVLLVLRAFSTSFTIAGGGVAGVFIPLVVCGALLGRMTAAAITSVNTTLFTVVGMAAFLGAGYRVPLAAVMFVAETTGRPGFVVPGLLAAVAADLMMGDRSITKYQLATN